MLKFPDHKFISALLPYEVLGITKKNRITSRQVSLHQFITVVFVTLDADPLLPTPRTETSLLSAASIN